MNFFQPSFKLIEKERFGARVSRRYETPATPCSRLLTSTAIDEKTKHRLRAVTLTLDPLKLLDEIRRVQHHVAGLSRGRELCMLSHRDADLEQFLAGLSTLWRSGEVRPTHQNAPKRKHDWRTRADPFADVWPQVLVWLETEPDRTAKELFIRLQSIHPGSFSYGQLRTLQRRVKAWRTLAAKKLILAPNGSIESDRSHTESLGNILSEPPSSKVT